MSGVLPRVGSWLTEYYTRFGRQEQTFSLFLFVIDEWKKVLWHWCQGGPIFCGKRPRLWFGVARSFCDVHQIWTTISDRKSRFVNKTLFAKLLNLPLYFSKALTFEKIVPTSFKFTDRIIENSNVFLNWLLFSPSAKGRLDSNPQSLTTASNVQVQPTLNQ